jgi:hypothetical protein
VSIEESSRDERSSGDRLDELRELGKRCGVRSHWRNELKFLNQELEEEETVALLVEAVWRTRGVLAVTKNRIIFARAKLGGLSTKVATRIIPMDHIEGIESTVIDGTPRLSLVINHPLLRGRTFIDFPRDARYPCADRVREFIAARIGSRAEA